MKAIVIVDMPNACEKCKFESEMLNCGKPMCVATPHRRERIEDDTIRPIWCPLMMIIGFRHDEIYNKAIISVEESTFSEYKRRTEKKLREKIDEVELIFEELMRGLK